MKIKRQIKARVYNRFLFMAKTFITITAIMWLKEKMVRHVIDSNIEELKERAENGGNYWAVDDDSRFETDVNILAEFGLPVVMADDHTLTEEGDMPCNRDQYFKDQWTNYKCVRVESSNGFFEEYYEEQKCHR